MNEYKYHYLFTSFDLETFDLEDFKYNYVNITSFRLVNRGDVVVKDILKDLTYYTQNIHNHNNAVLNLNKIGMIEVTVNKRIYRKTF